MKSRIAVAVSALTLGTALAVVPSFAQTPSNGTTAQQGSSGCVVFQQGCSDKPYPMNNQSSTEQNGSANGERTGTRQSTATPSASNRQRVVQDRERAAGETYRLGEPNRYNDYAPGVQVGAAAPGGMQWCEMRFQSYNPATGTYMGFDGVPHACP